MEKQFRVLLLLTAAGVMVTEGCSDESHKPFNFSDPGKKMISIALVSF